MLGKVSLRLQNLCSFIKRSKETYPWLFTLWSLGGIYSSDVQQTIPSKTKVNEARKLMFIDGLKGLENIPPTQHALFQHTKRAVLVAGFIWEKSLCKDAITPSASDWGWQWNARLKLWMPYWTVLPDASQGCALLLNCGCVVLCRGNCKCFRAGIRCGPFCKCEGGCSNNNTFTWSMYPIWEV